MESRWNDDDARRAIDRWGPVHGELLALRTYSARLLGSDPALVLLGGGNTSAKGRARSVAEEELDVLFIKGSGWDLATIEPAGHPAVRLHELTKLRALDALSDEAMVNAQRGALLDANAPNPSVECLLHAFLPHRFVDHTHADAVLAIADQPDAERICRDVYGEGLVFVPYVMPGFALAKACAAAFDRARGKAEVIVLGQHGVFTFGDDARESYLRMIDVVTRAENYVAGRRPRVAAPSTNDDGRRATDEAFKRRIAPILRGVLARAGGPSVLAWAPEPEARAFADAEDVAVLSQIGPATPDHVIRTKPWPMVADRALASMSDDDARASLEASAARFRDRYQRYVDDGVAARGERKRLDAAPRVIIVPEAGIVAAGATRPNAAGTAKIYAHTIGVIRAASALDRYRPVEPLDLFDLEYWPLEQAKLGKASARPLDGKIALVTGAGSGIGRATMERFVEAGAHVAGVDRDDLRLADACGALAAKGGNVLAIGGCDVTSASAVDAAFDACVDHFGGVDVVVSNAGDAPQGLLHTDEGARAFEASLGVNLLGHQHVARAASHVFLAQKTGGALLFNASKAAFNPGPKFGPYAIAKAATLALMRQYAIDLGSEGVRANAINADRVRTALFSDDVVASRAKARGLDPDAYFRANLLAREVTARDVADAFLFLATAPSTTGCVITVDGGNAAAFPR